MLKGIKKKIPTPKPKTVKELRIKSEGADLWGDGTHNYAQNEIMQALTELGFKVTFPDADTYQIDKHGKTDTGRIDQPLNIIIASARRLG